MKEEKKSSSLYQKAKVCGELQMLPNKLSIAFKEELDMFGRQMKTAPDWRSKEIVLSDVLALSVWGSVPCPHDAQVGRKSQKFCTRTNLK